MKLKKNKKKNEKEEENNVRGDTTSDCNEGERARSRARKTREIK